MSETMKDRIAKALAKDREDDKFWEEYREIADLVLAAMREPTSEMVFAANCLTAKQIIMPGIVWETTIAAA